MADRYELLWKVSGLFESTIDGWCHSHAAWKACRSDRSGGAMSELIATLRAGRRGRCISARAVVELRHPGFHSTPRIRQVLGTVQEVLRLRRYTFAEEPLPEQPLLAVRELTSRELRDEHHFLSELTGRSASPLRIGRTPNLRDFSAAISTTGPAWTLHSAEWELRRPVIANGRLTQAMCRVRVAPRRPGGRETAASFWVSIQLPWTGRGARPRWVRDARAVLTKQLRAACLDVEWFPAKAWPGAEGALTAYGLPMRSARRVEREALHLSELRLGDNI